MMKLVMDPTFSYDVECEGRTLRVALKAGASDEMFQHFGAVMASYVCLVKAGMLEITDVSNEAPEALREDAARGRKSEVMNPYVKKQGDGSDSASNPKNLSNPSSRDTSSIDGRPKTVEDIDIRDYYPVKRQIFMKQIG